MDNRDLISQKFFNQTGITMVVDSSIDDEFDVFNSVDLLARLTGAPDGSCITVSRGTGEADTFNLQVKNALFKHPSEYFIINAGGELSFELALDSIYVREEFQDQGIGVRSVMLSIQQAKELGFRSVTLDAAGSATNRGMFFGYHVWPTLGFDAPLTGQILGKLPQELQGCVLLSDIMRTDEGPDWWYDNGIALSLSFELEDDSVSWQLLNEYAKAREISIWQLNFCKRWRSSSRLRLAKYVMSVTSQKRLLVAWLLSRPTYIVGSELCQSLTLPGFGLPSINAQSHGFRGFRHLGGHRRNVPMCLHQLCFCPVKIYQFINCWYWQHSFIGLNAKGS